jgi:preprotein translocase subunit SecF
MTLALVNMLGMKLSAAGIVAFLMIIGYSVDSDILLTTKILKRKENVLNERIYSAFKTGMTMTLTSIAAVLVSLIVVATLSKTLSQIFTILSIGLGFDLINTWISNLGIMKWYVKTKGIE